MNKLISICALGLFFVGLSNQALARTPPNSHAVGKGWSCNTGYKRVGNQCNRIYVPPNARLQGANWVCNTGFKRVANQCNRAVQTSRVQPKRVVTPTRATRATRAVRTTRPVRQVRQTRPVYVPPNASRHGSGWRCNTGYKRMSNQCNPIQARTVARKPQPVVHRVAQATRAIYVPPNARRHGSGWLCNSGYKRVSNQCNPISRVVLKPIPRPTRQQHQNVMDIWWAQQMHIR